MKGEIWYVPVQPLQVWLAESGTGCYFCVHECLLWPEGHGWMAVLGDWRVPSSLPEWAWKGLAPLGHPPLEMHGEPDPSPLPPQPAEPLWPAPSPWTFAETMPASCMTSTPDCSGILSVFNMKFIISPVRLGGMTVFTMCNKDKTTQNNIILSSYIHLNWTHMHGQTTQAIVNHVTIWIK